MPVLLRDVFKAIFVYHRLRVLFSSFLLQYHISHSIAPTSVIHTAFGVIGKPYSTLLRSWSTFGWKARATSLARVVTVRLLNLCLVE